MLDAAPSNDEAAVYMQTRLKGADGLRGLACFVVLVMHATSFTYPAAIPYLTGCGKIGVWLFFTLSAFLLTVRLQANGLAYGSLLDYAAGRLLRIYPLFLLALGAHLAIGIAIDDWGQFLRAAALLYGPAHFWTIPVEMAFYVALPAFVAILSFLRRKHGHATMGFAVLLIAAAHQIAWPYWKTPDNSLNVAWYLPTFLFGVTAALMSDVRNFGSRTRTTFAVGILAIVALSAPVVRFAVWGIAPTRYLMDKHLFFGFGYAVLIWCVASRPTRLTSFFDSLPMAWMGRISYSTYLFHWGAMHLLLKVLPATPASVVCLVAGAFLIGFFMYWLAEQPLAELRRRLVSGPRVRTRTAVFNVA